MSAGVGSASEAVPFFFLLLLFLVVEELSSAPGGELEADGMTPVKTQAERPMTTPPRSTSRRVTVEIVMVDISDAGDASWTR